MPDDSNNVNTRDGASIEWGPEIRVDGKRPEWLADDQMLAYHDGHSWYGDSPCFRWTAHMVGRQQKVLPGDFDDWPNATAIRLPADHPHYSKAPTTPERDPALWDRMEALVRRMAERQTDSGDCLDIVAFLVEADCIVADLPKPVDPDPDPDLIEARKIEYEICDEQGIDPEPALRGEWDDKPGVRGVLRAIKRGRQLAGEQA